MRATKVLFWLSQLAGVAAMIWLLWGSEIPLGVPSDNWVWDRIPFDDAEFQTTLLGWGIAGTATVLYLAFCSFADSRVLEANRWEMTGI